MEKIKIVLVEDEEDISDLIKFQAEIEGFKVISEADGLNGYSTILKEKPALVILDIMIPGLSGLDLCRKMKSSDLLKEIPVIMISARGEELDVILGLELGADDYVTKPFSPKVLFSRVRSVLRRSSLQKNETTKTIQFSGFTLETEDYVLRKQDQIIPLTLSEFGILKKLLTSKGKVLTRNQLLDEIQSSDSFVVDRNIDVHIASLRKKLGPNFNSIETVRGVGYKMIDTD